MTMSSPTALAGQKPMVALALNQFSATIRLIIACASA
jgi:flavin reductase (DIM6/NTAB) family NADH-FMN oxidoreductase RutF